MEKTWKPTVAGILCIIAGAVGVLSGMVAVTHRELFYYFDFLVIVPVVAMVAIGGGIYALRRGKWPLALAGSICTLILGILMVFVVLMVLHWVSGIGDDVEFFLTSSFIACGIVFATPGILAMIFVRWGRGEFRGVAGPTAGTDLCARCAAPVTRQTAVCTSCGAPIGGATRRKTWKPTATGILCIVGGAVWLFPSMLFAYEYALAGSGEGTVISIVAITAIVGGIYALRRRIWGLALAASICTLVLEILMPAWLSTFFGEGYYNFLTPSFLAASVPFSIPGILATMFVVKGKSEFRRSAEPVR